MMSARAQRKAENRKHAARLFCQLTASTREYNCERAIAILHTRTLDNRIALDLGIKDGPGCAAIKNALRHAETTGQSVTFEDLTPDSREAFLCIGESALRQWIAQAGAIERAILCGKLAVRDGSTLVRYRGDSARIIGRANVFALVQLCSVIESNLGKPRAIRITFSGKVNPQVVQTTARLTDGQGVCPVARVTEIVPMVRAKLRQYHPRDDVGLCISPARTFQLTVA